jgi:hypothetical protein
MFPSATGLVALGQLRWEARQFRCGSRELSPLTRVSQACALP